MTTSHNRPLAAALLSALILLSIAPAVTATSSAGTPLHATAIPPSWLSWLSFDWLTTLGADQETFPDMDPDGAQATPAPPVFQEPAETRSQGSDDGDTFPSMDPNG